MKAVLMLAVLITLGLATVASAATKPKPWQWTTVQASAAIRAQAREVGDASVQYRGLEAVACRGSGKGAQGRYVAFRCAADFQDTGSLTDPNPNRATIWAKTRTAGGLCWSLGSLRAIPYRCLAKGPRATGSRLQASSAMLHVAGTMNHDFYCVANGSGFYSCSWQVGPTAEVVTHRGFVVFSPMPHAKVIS